MKGKIFSIKKNTKGIYGFIKNDNGGTTYFDTASIVRGNFLKVGSEVTFEIAELPNGKTKAVKLALVTNSGQGNVQQKTVPEETVIQETVCVLTDEKEKEIAEKLAERITEKGYVEYSTLPEVLNGLTVDYKTYAPNLAAFVNKYLCRYFQFLPEIMTQGVKHPNVLVPLDYVPEEYGTKRQEISGTGDREDVLGILEALLNEGKYEEFFSSSAFLKRTPDQLGADGVLLAIKAAAGYLGDDVQLSLNEFQRFLIEKERTADLMPLKDNEEILRQGMISSCAPMTMDEFKKCFANVLYTLNNVNNNWHAVAERFWEVKNDLAVYLNAVLLFVQKKDKNLRLYINKAHAMNDLSRIADMVRIWRSGASEEQLPIPIGMKRYLIGHCLECDDIEPLCKALELFDVETMPEARELPAYLRGEKEIDADTLSGYFHSDLEVQVSQKLVNLFWYRQKDVQLLPEMIVKVLSSVCWNYNKEYLDVILYNPTYADFKLPQKAGILMRAFEQLCEYTASYRKAYLLVNYVFVQLFARYADATDVPIEVLAAKWESLKSWMVHQVKSQLSDDLRTTQLIGIFKYDDAAMREVETFYCETYIKPVLDRCPDEDALEACIEQFKSEHIPFIDQWIENKYRNTSAHGVGILLQEQRYSEAIQWVQAQSELSVAQKKGTLRNILCENFKNKGFDESAYDIFAHAIPASLAETILLENMTANSDDVIEALFTIYVHQKNWLKVAYMYAPYNATRNKMRPKFYERIKLALIENGIDPIKGVVNHFEVIKTALKVLSHEEFDAFIDWAKKIQIPYGSRLYELNTRNFDAVIKNMLAGSDYDSSWEQLVRQALRTDNAEQQDTLRYSIIASYMGRYGASRVEAIMYELLSWRGQSKDFYGYYTSIWKGLFAGRYGCNILVLSKKLIKEAPVTYWNYFYDVAVCKNHVFALDCLWGTQWHKPDHDMQGFYSALVERYSECRDPVFLKIAVKLLEQYEGTIATEFDKYLSYCNSNKSKEFLFQAFISLLSQKKYLSDIGTLLKSGYWYNTDSERKLSAILELICDGDYEKFNEQMGLNWEEYWYDRFVSDFLQSFAEYPVIDVVGVVLRSDSSEQYRYQLVKNVFQIVYVKSQLDKLQNGGLLSAPRVDAGNAEAVTSYTDMMATCYRRQLQTDTAANIIWVQNRYHRILAAETLLKQDVEGYDDEDIVALMRNNKHFSDIFPNYKSFRELLKRLVKSEAMTDRQKNVILVSVVSNEWGEFLDHIAEYDRGDLANLHAMMELTNFRELNMQLLERYLLTMQGEYSEGDVALVSGYSPKLGYVLGELRTMKGRDAEKYSLISNILSSICRLTQQDRATVSYDKLDYTLTKNYETALENWDLFMNAFWAASYESTIIFKFGDDIRNIRKRCTWQKIARWEPVFRSVGKMPVYHYLVAVWYAIDRKREEAKAAYEKIVAKNEIPAAWTPERKDLEAFLSGRNNKFFVSTKKQVSSLSAEKEAQNLDFIAAAVGSGVVSNEDASAAYKTILGTTGKAAQLGAYKKLFGFVRNPDDLYEVYRQIDSKKEKTERKTYNELVIAFGALLIVEDADTFTHDEKFSILSSLMDVYELLSDVNKEKVTVRDQLKASESMVLGTEGLSLSVWLKNFDRIKAIMGHAAIENPATLLEELSVPVEQCVLHVGRCETQMQILDWLSEWRSNWNVSSTCSDYERAFIKAVDDELYRLRNGITLRLEVLNDENLIEDGSIFYQVENIAGRSNASVVLNNMAGNNSAQLEIRIGINGENPEIYDNPGFSSVVELRPGDVCGQAYKLHNSVLSRIKAGDRIEIILNVLINGVAICNNGADNRVFQYEEESGILASDMVSAATKYETAVPAFSRMIKGFGRDHERKLIREFLEQQLVIIYGPSRVGKSSLMNYINNEYVSEYHGKPGNQDTAIVTISIADDRNKSDYLIHMENGSEDVTGYSAARIMNYLFTAPLKVAFDSTNPLAQNRRRKEIGREFPEYVRNAIRNTISCPGSIRDKYAAISAVLEENNCQIWLLYDEFQQVIERWDGVAEELAELCNEIKYGMSGIKLVICGSDDLLRLFECENDPKWNDFKIRTAENSVPVGQLEHDDFVAMMEDQRIWARLEAYKPFSEAALKLLHQYTGGNAICGKIFGNEILNRLRNGLYSNRRKLYPSDVTQIAYSLLSSEVGLVRNLLVAHNTKNLENEIKYLLFIANELADDTNHADVSYRKIREFFVSRSTAEIDLALKILVARGILKTGADKKRYGFTTMFYYDFFKSQVSEAKMQVLYDNEHTVQTDDRMPWIDQVTEILKSQPKVTAGNMVDIINSLDDPDVKTGVGKQYGEARTTNIHTDTYVGENTGAITNQEIGTQNIIQINAQTINTALNTLLTSESGSAAFLEAMKGMPTVGAYLTETQKTELIALSGELEECETIEDIQETQQRMEALTAPVERKMLSDTVGAVVAADDFTDVSDERWIELLGIKSQRELDAIRKLPTEFVTPLGFAVMLHNVFDKIGRKMTEGSDDAPARELDYCPVAIMYCKVVEAALKKLHTPIYIDRIGELTVKFGGIQFRELLAPDGVTILPSKDLTIGSFAFNIVSTNRNNDVNRPAQFSASPKKSIIRRITNITDYSAAINVAWFDHAKDLAVVHAIRNKSAHDAAPITKANFDWLLQVLFRNGELIRIAELAEDA